MHGVIGFNTWGQVGRAGREKGREGGREEDLSYWFSTWDAGGGRGGRERKERKEGLMDGEMADGQMDR